MRDLIEFTEHDVDGEGSNVVMLYEVEGEKELTHSTIETLRKIVDERKAEAIKNDECFSTDEIVDAAIEYLESEGYKCNLIAPYSVDF